MSPGLRPCLTYTPHGLQEAGLLAITTGSQFSPVLPKLATQEQAATFHCCQAAHLLGLLHLGQGRGEGEDVAPFPRAVSSPPLCADPAAQGDNFQPLIKLSPVSRSIFRGGVGLPGIFEDLRCEGSTLNSGVQGVGDSNW